MNRRTFLISTGSFAAAIGTAGCSNAHHQPELFVSNSRPERARARVTLTRIDGPTLFDRRIDLGPEASAEYTDVLPRPGDGDDDTTTFRARAVLDTGPSAETEFKITSGFHQLWVDIDTELRIVTVVH